MRKFKLIKTYPGSPKLHSIVEVKPDGYIDWNVNSNENNPTNYIHNSAMEQYKEYWEEVVEKDYEILSFINVNNKIYELRPDGRYFNDELKYNDYKYCLEVLKIHSVKRKDGEIFTIGDKVQDSLTDELTNFKVQTITYFYPGDKIICQAESGTTMPLTTIRKVETPLFTTEDGVDIFENNTSIYHVDKSLNIKFIKHKDFKVISKNVKYFSTKEKAEEYVLMNKPCLSINDIVYGLKHAYITTPMFFELKYKVKSKL